MSMCDSVTYEFDLGICNGKKYKMPRANGSL